MSFPDNLGPRTLNAWRAIDYLLDDGQWHTHHDLVEAATLASDLTPKSIDELIRKGYRTHHYTRTKPHNDVASASYRRRLPDPMDGAP